MVPTREMISASMTAMRKRRQREGWVSEWRKHAWRLAAGVEASPHWDVEKPKSAGEQNTEGAGGFETADAPPDVAEEIPPAGLSYGDQEQRMALDTIHRLRQPLPEGWEFDRDGANERS